MNQILSALGMEKVASAAVRWGGEVFTGQNHYEAATKLVSRLQKEERFQRLSEDEILDKIYSSKDNLVQDGFVTSRGRFITPEEALEIAEQGLQISPDAPKSSRLFSEDLL